MYHLLVRQKTKAEGVLVMGLSINYSYCFQHWKNSAVCQWGEGECLAPHCPTESGPGNGALAAWLGLSAKPREQEENHGLWLLPAVLISMTLNDSELQVSGRTF